MTVVNQLNSLPLNVVKDYLRQFSSILGHMEGEDFGSGGGDGDRGLEAFGSAVTPSLYVNEEAAY